MRESPDEIDPRREVARLDVPVLLALEVAVCVLAEGRSRALTHWAVDAEAGIPEEKFSNQFRTRALLVRGVADELERRDRDFLASFDPAGISGETLPNLAAAFVTSELAEPTGQRARLALALDRDADLSPHHDRLDAPARGNLARYCFLDDRARLFYPEWEAAVDVIVAILRTGAGRDPRDTQLPDLVGELSTRSDEFQVCWGAHDERRHGSGTKHFCHHDVGEVELTFEGMELTVEPGLSFLIHTAEPGSPSQEQLDRLTGIRSTAAAGAR